MLGLDIGYGQKKGVLGKRLGNNGRRFLEENFSLKTCIDRYEKLQKIFVECE